MDIISFDTKKEYGALRRMNAANNGPAFKRHASDQNSGGNLALYSALRIPYARNHDANFNSGYGGPYTVDISAVFPNFDADENDPASYDFACTDEYIAVTELSGTKTFFRLGQSIEHRIKKYHIFPPKDNAKWARICEHIILHYNYGWADGYEYGIEYWEIWNEPDLGIDDDNKRTWAGTSEEFYDLFEVSAKHLKAKFPELRIGGPAVTFPNDWAERFLAEMHRRDVPMDFFSWHVYAREPEWILEASRRAREMMNKNGYGSAESILNEWNYVRSWEGLNFKYSLKSIIATKGGSFAFATMAECQKNSDVDMLMYYDARPCSFNGIFDDYNDALPGYYSFLWFAYMKDNGNEIRCEGAPENIYTLATKSASGKVMAAITYYTEREELAEPKEIEVKFGGIRPFMAYILDGEIGEVTGEAVRDLVFEMKPFTTVFIKQI